MTFESLKNDFISCIIKRRDVDYGDRASVRRYNYLAQKSWKDGVKINEVYPDRINDFAELLHHPDWDVKVACAHSLIVQMNCSETIKMEAVNTIKQYLTIAEPHEVLGWNWNLKRWGY